MTSQSGHSDVKSQKIEYLSRRFLYRRIFVYTFYLINICLSLSDDANKIKALNIGRAKQFKFSLKI